MHFGAIGAQNEDSARSIYPKSRAHVKARLGGKKTGNDSPQSKNDYTAKK
jgi:hypothetical protein